MPDPMARLWERFEARKKLGGRRLFETRKRAVEFTGPGGVRLTQAEKAELFQRGIDDPTGSVFEETLRLRQQANKLEGTTDIPADFFEWLKEGWAKRQEQGG